MATQQVQRAQWVAMAVRPFVILAGGLAVMWILTRLGDDGQGRRTLGFGSLIFDRLWITAQIAVVGLALSLAVGGALGLLARTSPGLDRLLGVVAVTAAALAAPVVTLTLVYWLAVRLGWVPLGAWLPISEDVGRYLQQLVIPTLVIMSATTIPIATTIRDTVRPWRARPLGLDAVAASIAHRSAQPARRLLGFPLGALAMALFSIELIAGVPGIFWVTIGAAIFNDGSTAFRAAIVLVVLGAVAAIVVDLFGAVATSGSADASDDVVLADLPPPTVPGTAEAAATPTARPAAAVLGAVVGGGLFGLVVVLALVGRLLGPPETSADRFESVLSTGHLLGTDFLGRDVARLLAFGAWATLWTAVVAGVIATAIGLGVAIVGNRLGQVGSVAANLAVDLLWWPLVLVLLWAANATDSFLVGSPVVLALLCLGLVPTAFRLTARERASGPLRPTVVVGVLALMIGAAVAVLVLATMVFSGPSDHWGVQLATARQDLQVVAHPAVVTGLAITALLFALNLLGASLLRLARPD